MTRFLLALFTATALVAAACGDGDADTTSTAGEDPIIAGQCAPGAPDCEDTVVVGEDPEPADDDDPETRIVDNGDRAGDPSSIGMVVDGGLTVSEALGTDAIGVLAVQGFVVAEAGSVRLCELLAESLPPQCGGASLVLAGVEAGGLDALPDDEDLGLESAQGVTWTDHAVTFFGEIVDGELVIDPLVTG